MSEVMGAKTQQKQVFKTFPRLLFSLTAIIPANGSKSTVQQHPEMPKKQQQRSRVPFRILNTAFLSRSKSTRNFVEQQN